MTCDPVDAEDAALWRRVGVENDADAFAMVYRKYSALIFRYCFRRTASVAEAEDLTSIVFLEMWRKRSKVSLHMDGTLLPWLYATALNSVRKGHRAQRRHSGALATLPAPADDPLDRVTARLDAERAMARVLERLATLPTADQEVLQLCAWEGLDMRTAAHVLGIPVGTVKSRLSRARNRLKDPDHRPLRRPVEEGAER